MVLNLLNIRIVLLLFLPVLLQAQQRAQLQVDSLRFVRDMPYICEGSIGCGDAYFWNVVRLKEAAIPYLLKKLTNTRRIEVSVPNFGGPYTVADVAYMALEEIIHGIPTFQLLGVPFDEKGCGYCAYWRHLRNSRRNRMRFQKQVQQWYNRNKEHLVWVESNAFSTCDCFGKHPNGGHFEVRQ
jgi:hypothetical protein